MENTISSEIRNLDELRKRRKVAETTAATLVKERLLEMLPSTLDQLQALEGKERIESFTKMKNAYKDVEDNNNDSIAIPALNISLFTPKHKSEQENKDEHPNIPDNN